MSDCQLKPVNVLIVEDYDVSSMIIQDMLSTIGLDPQIATNGEEALENIRGGDFDVIFLDIQLGSESGLDVSKAIRKMNIKQPLIIACTANTAITSKDAVLEAGMDDFLAKPVSIKSFREMLVKHKVIDS